MDKYNKEVATAQVKSIVTHFADKWDISETKARAFITKVIRIEQGAFKAGVTEGQMMQELIKRLEIRKEQLLQQAEGVRTGYRIHENHHLRDVMTTLAVLKSEENAEKLLKNMPNEEDI